MSRDRTPFHCSPSLRRLFSTAILLTSGVAGAQGAGDPPPGANGPAAAPDRYPSKPARAQVDARFLQDRITVKFKDGRTVRERNGALTDLGTGALDQAQARLAQFNGARWERSHGKVSEENLKAMVDDATRNANKPMPDLNLQFNLILPLGTDAATTIDALNALDVVEMAQPIPAVVMTAVAPDFVPNQVYRRSSPVGMGTERVRNLPGGTGAAVRIVDVEFSWNLSHQDLPPVTVLANGYDPFNSTDHGTAVLGVLAAKDNGTGITGIVPNAQLFVSPAMTASGQGVSHIPDAITLAASVLGPGDVILLELQMSGPNYQGCCQFNNCPPGVDCNIGLVPIEWYKPAYDAMMVAAQSRHVIIVEAAGNGSQNLSDPIYQTGNGGHWPFHFNNPNIIMVGAGAAPAESGGSDNDRSRLPFSNYGQATYTSMDVQGWGESVWTTGYGLALGAPGYTAGGTNQLYTGRFNGTSSASATIAGVVGQIQSIYKTIVGPTINAPAPEAHVLNCSQMESALYFSGQQQQGNWVPPTLPPPPPPPPGAFTIGPRPDAALALRYIGNLTTDDYRWCPVNSAPIIPHLNSARMVYDSARQRSVVFGGNFNAPPWGSNIYTWEFDGTNWSQSFAPPMPPRAGHAMAFDSARGVTVCYGGTGPNGWMNELLEYNGTSWITINTLNSPGPRGNSAMAYDSVRQVVVLFGGETINGPQSGETWEYNGLNWSLRSTTGPTPTSGHAMAFDALRGKTVLYGGIYQPYDETWEWNGTTWTKRNTSGPGTTFNPAMAFDSTRNVIVLVSNSNPDSSTWEYDGRSWAAVDRTNTCSGGATPALAYDSNLQRMMLLTGDFGAPGSDFRQFRPAMGFTQLPASRTVHTGQNVTFSVAASNANTGPVFYQWKHNGQILVDNSHISGAFTPALTVNSVTLADTGSYVVVANSLDVCDSISNFPNYQSFPLQSLLQGAFLNVLSCDADISGDGVVNVNDLLMLINSWGPCPQPCPQYCAADITHDCFVNVNDLLALINAWGTCP